MPTEDAFKGLPGLPEATMQWPLPAPAASELRLALEMASTGLVGSALVVRLRLQNAKRSDHEDSMPRGSYRVYRQCPFRVTGRLGGSRPKSSVRIEPNLASS